MAHLHGSRWSERRRSAGHQGMVPGKTCFFNGEKTTINEKQTTNKGETDINDRTGTTLDVINDIFYK